MRHALASLLLIGCVDAAPPAIETAPAPLVGVDGSHDAADRACNVVLRDLGRTGTTPDGENWVWDGTVEISAAAAAEGLVPHVLYSFGTPTSTWFQATVAPLATGATPGYAKFGVHMDHDLPGPGQSPIANVVVVPYLALAGGGRLFDHNRNAGDFANYVMAAPDLAVFGAPAVCGAAQAPQVAKLVFAADFTQHREGVLAAGGTVEIDYATTRLDHCKQVQGGHDLWGLTAHVRFDPAGELRDVNVTEGPGTVPVPSDARRAEVWFEATSVTGCHEWDSNFGANYSFEAATAPQWLGLAGNLIVRDANDGCDGGGAATGGFGFDTWARQRAAVSNLCFQVYQPGVTDTDANPWQALDAELHYKFAGQTAWTTVPVAFDRRAGNNSRYAVSWRGLDPFRSYHCPEVPSTPSANGQYAEIGVQYYATVNGAELRPEPGAAFAGTFSDYPSDAWRSANCH